MHKADHKLISDRKPAVNADKSTPSADPFIGIKLVESTKKLDARFNSPGGKASSPDKARSLNTLQQMASGELCKINLKHDKDSEN